MPGNAKKKIIVLKFSSLMVLISFGRKISIQLAVSFGALLTKHTTERDNKQKDQDVTEIRKNVLRNSTVRIE